MWSWSYQRAEWGAWGCRSSPVRGRSRARVPGEKSEELRNVWSLRGALRASARSSAEVDDTDWLRNHESIKGRRVSKWTPTGAVDQLLVTLKRILKRDDRANRLGEPSRCRWWIISTIERKWACGSISKGTAVTTKKWFDFWLSGKRLDESTHNEFSKLQDLFKERRLRRVSSPVLRS